MSKSRPTHTPPKAEEGHNPATTAAVLAFEMRPVASGAGDAVIAPTHVQVFPLGEIVAQDGRGFRLSDAQLVVNRIAARLADRPILVDYDHRSYFQPFEGGDQVAAGWVTSAEAREGGIWVSIDWTPAAAAAIAAREYRYVSPEFTAGAGGEIIALDAVALVNRPAFRMAALANAQPNPAKTGDLEMKKIALALSLTEDATEEAILAAIETKKTELASAQKPPAPDKYVTRADYDTVLASANDAKTELANLKKASREADVEKVLAAAVSEGKIAPASKDHYKALAQSEEGFEQVKALCATLPKLIGNPGIETGNPDAGGELSELEKHTAAQLGLTEAEFLKHRGAAA